MIGTVFLSDGQLVLTAGRGDNGGAHLFAQLHGSQADAAGGAVHQQDLARLQIELVLEADVRGSIDDRESCGGDVVHAVWHFVDRFTRRHNLFGVAAP